MNALWFNKFILGAISITIGVFFLLDQTGLIEFDIGYLFSAYWPAALIYVGLMGFVWQSRQNFGSAVWNLMICSVGVIFLLKNLQLTTLSIGDLLKYLGPVALILFGISMIFKPLRRSDHSKNYHFSDDCSYDRREKREQRRQAREEARAVRREERRSHWEAPHQSETKKSTAELSDEEKEVLKDIHGEFAPDMHRKVWDLSKPPAPSKTSKHMGEKNKYHDFVNNYYTEGVQYKSSFIGDVHLGQQPWELQPMVISHFIGDTIIDLTRAAIPLGETPLTISAFIGDVKIFIPNDMDIEVRVTSSSFIGDMNILDRKETGMFRHLRTESPYFDEAQRKLIVTTSMFIGDVVVKKIG